MKILYKIMHSVVIVCIAPVLLFVPILRFVMTVSMGAGKGLGALIGGFVDISAVIERVTGINPEKLPEYYTLPQLIGLFSGDGAQIKTDGFDASAVPAELTRPFIAMLVFFALMLLLAVLALLIGLFAKKYLLPMIFSAGSLCSALAMRLCFGAWAGKLQSGAVSLTSVLGGLPDLAEYKKYLDMLKFDIRVLDTASAYTLLILVLAAVLIMDIGFFIWKKSRG